MKTLLVLAQHPEFPNSVRAALNPDDFRVIHRIELAEAEPLLVSRNVDAVILDVEQEDVRSLWTIERLRRIQPTCPIIALSAPAGWELAEDAYLQGVSFILQKPIRRRLLTDILRRTLERQPRTAALSPPAIASAVPMAAPALEAPAASRDSLQAFGTLSGILGGSLSVQGVLERSLQVLRNTLSVNRAALFFRFPTRAGSSEDMSRRTFKVASAIGLPTNLLDHFELSFETGIGGAVTRTGRVLRRESPEALSDPEIQKEFELLGVKVAVPVVDPHTVVGIALFDDHLTGEPLTSRELASVFHLLEELGLVVRNIQLHDQVAANHEVLAGVLRDLGSACVVVNRELEVIHVNKAARHYFSKRRTAELEFNDLPAALGTKVYQVFQTGSAIAPFRFNPPDSPQTVYQVTISPVHAVARPEALPRAVMLLAEDRTQAEELKRLEVDSSNLQQVKTIGGRLAHEINNAVMPLHLIQQELEKRIKDRDLTSVLADSVKRIARRGAEMRALAQDSIISRRTFPLAEVVEEAFEEAQRHQTGTTAKLNSNVGQLLTVNGDREAIKLALTEVLLNAIQANSKDPKVAITSDSNADSSGAPSVTLEVRDNGPGFSADALTKALQPFYTTKTVGLGVGLSVAEKIISLHRGSLTIGNASEGTGGVVQIKLPLEPSPAKERTEKRPTAGT